MNVVLKQEAMFEDAQHRFHPNTLAQQHWSIPLNPCRCKSVSRKADGHKLTMTFSQLQRRHVFWVEPRSQHTYPCFLADRMGTSR
jgi:hypothetical protein